MKSTRDQDLLSFLLGELTLLKRLGVRMRLAFSESARRRLSELERVAGAVAGAIGVGGVAGFQANKRVKRRRLMFVDLAVAAIMLSALSAGSVGAWRALSPPVKSADSCPTDSAGNPIRMAPAAKSHPKKHMLKTVQPAS
jgi:hypothetical protein